MKTHIQTALAVMAVIAVSGCGYLSDPTAPPKNLTLVPQDVVRDVSRGDAPFAYETYVSVGLDLTVTVLESEGERVPGDDTLVIVTVTDPEGNKLYTGKAANDGSVDAHFGVTTNTESVTLTLSGPGLETRKVTVQAPPELSTIRREMQIVAGGLGIAVSGSEDRDGDGVPDLYDAYPDDPTIAFEVPFPGDGAKVFTVAYEDNFPNLGDGDYNDFVADYFVKASFGRNGILVRLEGEATARAKVAGYDHEFGLVFRIPGFEGTVWTTLDGVERVSDVEVGELVRIPLFPSTAAATSGGTTSVATFDVLFSNERGSTATIEDLPPAPFDPYLYIKNTGYDVHLIDRPPLPESKITWDEAFRDAAGFPRGLLVPSSFSPPKEVTSILDAYPEFQPWVDAEGGNDADGNPTSDWYLYPNPELVMSLGSP
jgi:LruC domain-containing protein